MADQKAGEASLMALRVVHAVQTGLPRQAGYTLRTQALVSALQRHGVDASVAVAPEGNPLVGQRPVAEGVGRRMVGSVAYYRHFETRPLRRWAMQLRQFAQDHRLPCAYRFGQPRPVSEDAFLRLLRRLPAPYALPDLVHAHTPPTTARYGLRFARETGVPFVYEMRGFWEQTAAAEGKSNLLGCGLNDWRQADTELAHQADRVVTLGSAMREELIGRGIDGRKIHISRNGVDSDTCQPLAEPDRTLQQQLGLAGRYVCGSVTNVRRLEGLHVLLQASRILLDAGLPVSVLIVGEGTELKALRALAAQLKVADHTHFIGQVPHRLVNRYYSLMDVFVLPRINAEVCRLVTPLKPLEAMAFGVPVVASALPALQEIVDHGRTGRTFRADDAADLAMALQHLHAAPQQRARLAQSARAWVRRERDWVEAAQGLLGLYQDVLAEG